MSKRIDRWLKEKVGRLPQGFCFSVRGEEIHIYYNGPDFLKLSAPSALSNNSRRGAWVGMVMLRPSRISDAIALFWKIIENQQKRLKGEGG